MQMNNWGKSRFTSFFIINLLNWETTKNLTWKIILIIITNYYNNFLFWSDFDNGDSGIYEDLLKRNSVLTKQKSNTFDVARLPPYDADAETKAYWECVLSSATNSGVLSECSFQLSQSTDSKLRRERFKALRSNVGNKWASFSSSFLKLVIAWIQ